MQLSAFLLTSILLAVVGYLGQIVGRRIAGGRTGVDAILNTQHLDSRDVKCIHTRHLAHALGAERHLALCHLQVRVHETQLPDDFARVAHEAEAQLARAVGLATVTKPSTRSNNRTIAVDTSTPADSSPNAIRIVPIGTKTYVAGLRATPEGNNRCGATLISPMHLLTGTYCIYNDIRWASIGSHYVNGTQDGEQIKVVGILNHPKSSNANFSNEFAILVLQNPSSFKPAVLAAVDDSDVKDGEWVSKIGWDDTGGKGTMAYELTRADVQLMSNENCLNETNVDDTMVCTRGIPSEASCTGDYGGPLVVEKPTGDVVVGVVSWGSDCFKPGYPSIYSRVSSARSWIQSVVGGVCFH